MHPDQTRPMTAVRPGMAVVDRDGQPVGTVDTVRMSDPGAVTAQGQDQAPAGLFAAAAEARTGSPEPKVPAPAAERLIRIGYLKIDRPGPTDAYAGADEVASVHGDEVHLTVAEDTLMKEA
jgi:hypothetical protein